jgi:1-phosphofructokinase
MGLKKADKISDILISKYDSLDGIICAAGLYSQPYLVKPNDIELSGLLGRTLTTPEELKEAAEYSTIQELMPKVSFQMI